MKLNRIRLLGLSGNLLFTILFVFAGLAFFAATSTHVSASSETYQQMKKIFKGLLSNEYIRQGKARSDFEGRYTYRDDSQAIVVSNQTINYTITVSASPSAGGKVNGGGTFAEGSSRTVTATANSGYTFSNWTENESVVSSSASYTFTLNADRNLVANFTPDQVNFMNPSVSSAGDIAGSVGTSTGVSSRMTTDTANSGSTLAERADNARGPSVNSDVTAVTGAAGAGLVINATFDSSITNSANSAAIQAMINQAIAIYQSKFSDPITVSILFRYSTTGPNGSPLGSGSLAQSNFVVYTVSWNNYINALKADAKTTNDATANTSLPASSLSTSIKPSSAGGRAVGLNTPPAMFSDGSLGTGAPYDGIVTLNSAQSFQFTRPPGGNYDALRSTEHEIDEVIGLGSYLNGNGSDLRPQDLFSWSAPGVRNTTSSGSRYFSINSGNTNIVSFNQDSGGDFGDWISGSCPQANPYVQNAFSCAGQVSDVTETSPEGINLDVVGYDLVTTPQNYTITVSASPPAGGTVSGGGTFAGGSSRTVTATASSGYTFVSWTESGIVVSLTPSYTFTLNANRTLVANFTNSPVSYDTTLKAPKCGQLGSVCDSSTLLNGRDSLAGGTEPNQPNTINNSCPDGASGTYHVDESSDAIKVSTLDNSNFAPGKTVKIDVTVWVYQDFASDHLDLYYAADANNPNWIYLTTLNPSSAGAQVLSTTYTLPGGSLQAVRATFRFGGIASSCGTNSGYDDHDDLIFTASTPVVTRTLTVASSNPNSGVSITLNPSDNSGLSSGTTQFTRTYNNNTVVNLTAPTSAGGNNFQKWQRDGADWATTLSSSVTMDANHTMTAVYVAQAQPLRIDSVTPAAGRASGGQQIKLAGSFANLSTVTIGGVSSSWSYTNGISEITVTTPQHAVGAVSIVLTPSAGATVSKANAFAYLPTVFTDNTLVAGVTTAKAQHIIELRQAVDALRAVAGLSPAPWTDASLVPTNNIIRTVHIQELRTYLNDAATRLGYATQPYTDSSLSAGFVIKRVHIEELRQRIRVIAG
jgi:hypothetical protein